MTHHIIEQSFTVPCKYGSAAFVFPQNSFDPEKVQVIAADLVFTDHPSYDNLKKLNTDRFIQLFNKYPSLADKNIEWKLVRQMTGVTKATALNMFHGFVIYYRPLQNKETMQSDILKLKDMLVPKDGSPGKKRNGFIAVDTTELRKIYEIEPYTTVLKLPVNEAIHFLGMDESETVNYKKYDSVFVYAKPSEDTLEKISIKPPPDSTVLKVLDRMHWNRMLMVADVTASMYPYTGQLMLWMKLHEDERRIERFIFFNDGDNKDDDLKVIGRTGGIYTTASSVFEVAEQLAFKAMSNGSGGSIPENNIEALISGIAACPECSSVIMIADNYSGVSDMALLKQLHKPVRIILCGVLEKINIDYLNIARSTSGSIHLMETDLLNLADLKEGESITILGHSYSIVNGSFQLKK